MTEFEAIVLRELWRFADLRLLGIVADRKTLRRWMETQGFPQPIILTANSIAWRSAEVREWVDSRPRGLAPQPARQRKAA